MLPAEDELALAFEPEETHFLIACPAGILIGLIQVG